MEKLKPNHTGHHDDPREGSFWESRWQQGTTGWDLGVASPPIVNYMHSYSNKKSAILIPGCGNAYEAAHLIQEGFINITLLDIAPKPVEKLSKVFGGNPYVRLRCEDFFQHEGHYDLMIEQTFFCAIPPAMRADYVAKAAELLSGGGILTGVLFNRMFDKDGPPFGGLDAEYRELFGPFFEIRKMEICYNSIAPRKDTELFIEMKSRK